jgi:hypothetical protein
MKTTATTFIILVASLLNANATSSYASAKKTTKAKAGKSHVSVTETKAHKANKPVQPVTDNILRGRF